MKRGFLAILVMCAVMLLGGCREGGWSATDVLFSESSAMSEASSQSAQSAAELNVGVRSSVGVMSSSAPLSSSVKSAETAVSDIVPNEISTVSAASMPQIVEEPAASSIESIPQTVLVIPEPPAESDAPIISSTVSEASNVSESSAESVGSSSLEIVSEPEVSTASSAETSEAVSEPSSAASENPYDYEGTVYIAASGNGKRYHKNPNCSRMKGSLAMTVDEALKKGYTPCKNCW